MEQKKYCFIEMNRNIYDKDNCVNIARELLNKKKITEMGVNQLAQEIYGHAYVYYNFKKAPKWFQSSRLGKSMFESSNNGVDLLSGGDTWYRQIFYYICWFLPKYEK